MENIYYKGYRLYYYKESHSNNYCANVLGRDSARFKGSGKTKKEAINNLKKEIDKVR